MSQPVVSGPRARHQVTTPHATSSDRQHASEQPDQDADSKKAGKLQAFVSPPAFWTLLLEHSRGLAQPESPLSA